MHVIIRKYEGGCYTSEVFGVYHNEVPAYKEYGLTSYDIYYIVLNEAKDRLVKEYLYPTDEHGYIFTRLIVVDTDKSGWNTDEKGFGEVGFTTRADLERCVENGELPERLSELDRKYRYQEIREIVSEKDIQDFLCATGYLHDASFCDDIQSFDDGFRVVFGPWGCKVELWFEGDAEYRLSDHYSQVLPNAELRESGVYDLFTCTMLIEDDFVWLFDDEVENAADGQDCDLIMKARRVKYRIIPK